MTRYLEPSEYAERAGLPESLVRRMARDGRLPRADTRRVLIPEDAEPTTRVYDAGRERPQRGLPDAAIQRQEVRHRHRGRPAGKQAGVSARPQGQRPAPGLPGVEGHAAGARGAAGTRSGGAGRLPDDAWTVPRRMAG